MKQEAKKIEIYARLWRAYYFYFVYHFHKHFLGEKIGFEDVKFPRDDVLIDGVMVIVVNYYYDVEHWLKRDAYRDALAFFTEDHDIVSYLHPTVRKFNEDSYFEKVALPATFDNEIIDQFLTYDSKITSLPQKHIKRVLKSVEDDPDEWFIFEPDPIVECLAGLNQIEKRTKNANNGDTCK